MQFCQVNQKNHDNVEHFYVVNLIKLSIALKQTDLMQLPMVAKTMKYNLGKKKEQQYQQT